MAIARTYSAGKFLLTIDGIVCGSVLSVEGGEPFAEVSENLLDTGVVDKQIGALRYQPIAFEVSLPLDKPLYDWIAAFLDRSPQRLSGVISMFSYDWAEQSRLEWEDAFITEVAFPALDGSSKDVGRLSCVIQPTRTRRVAGSGSPSKSKAATTQKKPWLKSNFKLTMPGFETSAQHVSLIDPLVIRQPVMLVDGSLTAGTLQIHPVVLTVSAGFAEPLFAWFADFVVDGHHEEADERSASLELRSANMNEVVLGLTLQNLGIFRVSQFRLVGDADSIQKVRADLYCERMALTPASAPAQPPAVDPAPAVDVTPALANLAEAVAGILRQTVAEAVQPPVVAVAPAPAPGYRADAIARRLLATAAAVRVEAVEAQEARRARGVTLGTEWAATTATLGELERLARLAASDWSAIVLREDDTLIRFLVKRGELDEGEAGPLDLTRDAFTEGLVAGAADIRSKAAVHLDGARPT